MLFVGTPLFLGAGTVRWVRGWAFLALLGFTFLTNLTVMMVKNPVLLRERWKRRSDTKPFDRLFGAVYLVSTVGMLAVAGMDTVRFRWTSMAESLAYGGVALHVLGMVPVVWSMVANPHLETTVRIQNDRGHRVISDGPYRYVRHPMYFGMILMYMGWSLVLGSWVASCFACVVVLVLLVRTGLEDRTLKAELEGYADYCRRTRYRLLPGVW